jgi:hypothetical protein
MEMKRVTRYNGVMTLAGGEVTLEKGKGGDDAIHHLEKGKGGYDTTDLKK